MKIARSAAIAFLVLACSLAPAQAQDAAAGKRIAKEFCSACHAVDLRRRRSPNPAAPPFRAVARMSSTTETSLGVFLTTSHEPMPNFVLSRREIADLTAYILSLRKPGQKTWSEIPSAMPSKRSREP